MSQLHHAFSVDYSGRPPSIITAARIQLPADIPQTGPRREMVVNALWDTGAESTVITPEVADALNLIPVSKVMLFGINDSEGKVKDQFFVDIILPNNVLLQGVIVSESEIKSRPIENVKMIVGMDIIQLGDFVISNANGKTKFSYCIPPHKNPVCLVQKTLKVNAPILKKENMRPIAIKTIHDKRD